MIARIVQSAALLLATLGRPAVAAAPSNLAPPPAPAARAIRVELQLVRLAPGAGSVLVSSGIPLAPGALRVADVPLVRVLVDGAERAAYVEPLRGRHPDGSVQSVLVQFRAPVAGPSAEATLEIGTRAGVARLARAGGDLGRPAAVALPVSADYLVATLIVGETLTVREAARRSAVIRRHDETFARFADRHWARDGANWEKGNYYDRAAIYYAAWARTGKAEYWRRGTEMALDYRRNYLEASEYKASAHWAMLDGMVLHYLLTGDEASRTAVGRVADQMAVPYYMSNLQSTTAEMENRMQARVLLSFVLADAVDAPSREGHQWEALARQALPKILASQSPDGAYRFKYPGVNQCGHNKPFMAGLLNDALIRYHARVEADRRILPAVRKSLDYMWRNNWRARDRAFVYLDGPCGRDRVGVAPDLNNLLVTGYAWYARESGDDEYRRRADEIFAAAAAGSWLDGAKQFNQQYSATHNYIGYRAPR
jgi:hypothetical protein